MVTDSKKSAEREWMTIEQLSFETGVSTRNIRAFQSRRLMPPPNMVQRTGYYDAGHVARVRLIVSLQERGYSLAGIGDLLEAWEKGRSLHHLIGFEEVLTSRWKKRNGLLTREELLELLGGVEPQRADVELAEKLGLFWREGDKYRVARPDLMFFGTEALQTGLPLSAGLKELANIIADSHVTAERFVNLYLDNFWKPFVKDGMPTERVEEVTQALDTLRRVALQIVYEATESSLEEAIEEKTAELFPKSGQQDEK